MHIPQLLPAHTLAPRRNYERLLRPCEFPIHPLVHANPASYSGEMIDEIDRRLPAELRADIAAMERLLGWKPAVEVTREGAYGPHSGMRFRDIQMRVDPARRDFSASYVESNINTWVPNRELFFTLDDRPQLPNEILDAYIIPDTRRFHTWYGHNVHDAGDKGLLCFRSIARLFNNIGLEMLNR